MSRGDGHAKQVLVTLKINIQLNNIADMVKQATWFLMIDCFAKLSIGVDVDLLGKQVSRQSTVW